MSGSSPAPTGGQDQSMDDILASIRRILNEDEAEATASAEPIQEAAAQPAETAEPVTSSSPVVTPVVPPPAAPAAAEPLELTADMLAASSHEAPPIKPIESSKTSEMDMTGLIAPAAAAAATASIGSLLRTVSSERNALVHRGGPTLEDLVRDEMRPMLKEWLDTNLPPLVERLVRAEIERVVNRGLA